MKKNFYLLFIILTIFCTNTFAQIISSHDIQIDYASPKEFEIGGITISGVQYLDNSVLLMLTGLNVGDNVKVPGDKLSKAIENLWKQGLFSSIKIVATKIEGNLIFFDIQVVERPRLSRFEFKGVKKSQADDIREEIKIARGDVITENLLMRTEYKIKKYFIDKGYLNVSVNIIRKKDTLLTNYQSLIIEINKNNKTKIKNINIYGNENLSDKKIYRILKKTKRKKLYRVFATSKFLEEEFKNDKAKIIDKYNELGYRDAQIIKDSIYKNDDKTINIDLYISEGRKYYFRNITWVGNTKYSADVLNAILRIKKGDPYNQKLLEQNLNFSMDARDVSSLYQDDGYLFFSVTPVEKWVENDSIDLEIRIYEGKQASINKVLIKGNTKTNDNVIIREIRTKPGQLFSRSDILRTQRELAQLRYFNAEKIGINPKPNPVDGTVDIEYEVEETSSDMVELSGGWGGGRLVLTLGLSFNNFAGKDLFKGSAWRPLPSGGGQKVSVRAQTYGVGYQSYNASFTEPWLGGKKPNSLSVSIYNTKFNANGLSRKDENRQTLTIWGSSVGLGQRLAWPDDYFTVYQAISYQNYNLHNYPALFSFSNGNSNNLSYNFVIGRNSVDAPIYARSGSEVSLTTQFTPPYSLFSKTNYSLLTDAERYKWIEFHKWKMNFGFYTKLAGNLVAYTRTKFGFLGLYNREIGLSPFERFYLGGDGLSGFNMMDGREVIGMRGYKNNTLTPMVNGNYVGGTIYNKYTMELRYPISLNPMATVYTLAFVEAGNAWLQFKDFNAFDVKRSAGVGVRIFLPMIGQLGLDWGYGFDDIPGVVGANKSQFHFSINQSID